MPIATAMSKPNFQDRSSASALVVSYAQLEMHLQSTLKYYTVSEMTLNYQKTYITRNSCVHGHPNWREPKRSVTVLAEASAMITKNHFIKCNATKRSWVHNDDKQLRRMDLLKLPQTSMLPYTNYSKQNSGKPHLWLKSHETTQNFCLQ